MDFNLTEDQKLIRNTVRDFAERVIKPVAKELDEKEEFSLETTKQIGELGLFGIYLPEKYGGQNLDTTCYIIAVEELARVDGSHA
ncbi:MAG: acyl-CoA dehydrogenase family protein, partial [Ignavibacteria bacterium]|nr:acyl-CoA dehydrogenase family protein [Ignavibacteria bacterium]